ncbi:hypothetical protein WG901_04070 [Novosphingobium sp. PS1R-30]|uniref:Uncharacterized protein n=1 Tax=Novosphingobium anseongense TaxID=3133436 RepID=A0ABU8RS19_9SPHN
MALPLEQAKAERNAAYSAFQNQLAQVQEDLAMRSIGGRIADRASEAMADAAEVANENKGVIAGTIGAIILWFLRGPIINLVAGLWADDDETERKADDD